MERRIKVRAMIAPLLFLIAGFSSFGPSALAASASAALLKARQEAESNIMCSLRATMK